MTSQATDKSVGKPLDRVDGRLKVTGGARYSAEIPVVNVAYGVLVSSTETKATITAMDTSDALRVPGVITILTPFNRPPAQQHKAEDNQANIPLLQDTKVRFNRQPIGVVVADTFEHAKDAASRVKVTYDTQKPMTVMADHLEEAHPPKNVHGDSSDKTRGDMAAGLAQADVTVDHTYSTPQENHNPMEMHATIAVWEGEHLTLYDATQGVFAAQKQVAHSLNMPPENVRIVSYFLGGGFGCKGTAWSHVPLAAMAAREAGRPVKIMLERAQMYGPVGYRPETIQRVTLGAKADGTLTALRHTTTNNVASYDEFTEPSALTARMVYNSPNMESSHRLVALDYGKPTYMRAPGEASGSFALESAMDELAYALKMDPVALRLKNYAETDPDKNLPFSSKSLRACYAQGASRFGWDKRNPAVGSMRAPDGRLIGWGMATATYPTNRQASSAKATIYADGHALVQAGSQDIGTGTYTVMTQVAADALGLPPARVRFELGDTRLPETPVSGGSQTAASTGSAVKMAGLALRDKFIGLAITDPASPLHGATVDTVSASDGRLSLLSDPHQGETYQDILKRQELTQLDAQVKSAPGDERQQYSMHSFGAQFCEVLVEPDTGQVRVSRWVSAIGGGRILNAKTARSQIIGGVVYGIGMGLLEHTVPDTRNGRIMTADLAEYHVPVHADVPHIDAFFVEEEDPHVNPIGVKGIGEIGITGVAAALANAVYHATGQRVRDLPITLDKVMVS